MKIKFGVLDPVGETVRYAHPDVFLASDEPRDRLIIAPSANHVSLIFDLARCWQIDEYWLLYVLLTGHEGRDRGRYESPALSSSDELKDFLTRFGPFLEQDGRHALWIGSSAGEGTLVYDQHDVIFAYGPTHAYREVLARRGFAEHDFQYPDPHVHCYYAEFDAVEDELFALWEWEQFPLQDDDHY